MESDLVFSAAQIHSINDNLLNLRDGRKEAKEKTPVVQIPKHFELILSILEFLYLLCSHLSFFFLSVH